MPTFEQYNIRTTSSGAAETTATIQAKRPLKTVGSTSLEGDGNVPFPTIPTVPTYIKLSSNATNNAVTFTNVGDLSFTALASKTYLIELRGAYKTAATTTGIGVALDIPSGTIIGQFVTNVSATGLGGSAQVLDNTTKGATTGVQVLNENTPILGWWIVNTSTTGGTIQLKMRSEIAASLCTLVSGLTVLSYIEI